VNRASLAAVMMLLLMRSVIAQQCDQKCVQALQQSGAPLFDLQRQCCPLTSTTTSQEPLDNICTYNTGTCKLVQSNPVGSSCVCPTPSGPTLGLIAADWDRLVAGSGQIVETGRWTTGSSDRCRTYYYDWIIGDNRMMFKDQFGQIDIERILEKRPDEYVTVTIASIHDRTPGERVGARWTYRNQANGTYLVEQQFDRRNFKLSKCQ